MQNSSKLLLSSVIVLALLFVGVGLPSQAQGSNNKKTAEAIGWAIGCGCLKHTEETIARYLGIFFPDLSSQQAESLAGYVSVGANESRVYDNSDQICSNVCTAVDWGSINNQIDRLNAVVAKTTPQISAEAHPFDGTWTGKAVIANQWCGSGRKRFSLTLTVAGGRVRGGDPDGAYAAAGQVGADGRLIGVSLNNRLLMEGSIREGKIRLANYDCGGRYSLKKDDAEKLVTESDSLTQETSAQMPKPQTAATPAAEQQAALTESDDEPQGAKESKVNDAPTNQLETAVAKATPEPEGHFDGRWVLEIREPAQMPDGDKVPIDIVDGEFTADVSANGWRGTVSGRIDQYGTLVATGNLRKPSRPSALLKWSVGPSGDRYIANVTATTLWLTMTFEVSLSRSAVSSDDGSSK